MFEKFRKNSSIIVKTDGGICSQISFYALGKAFENRGFDVKYDVSWFKDCGRDMNGKFERPYTLEKAFPSIKTKVATEAEIKKQRRRNHFKNRPFDKISPPCYIDGYPLYRFGKVIENLDWFRENFNPIGVEVCADILEKIENSDSCAAHIRRGDLSSYLPFYGYPPETEYFNLATKIILGIDPAVKFYFFSDEPDWVKNELIPKLDREIKYEIVAKNGSENGYLDLYLTSRAKYIVASQGSMGFFAKMLSKNNPLAIFPHNRSGLRTTIESLPNCVYINEDVRLELKYKK